MVRKIISIGLIVVGFLSVASGIGLTAYNVWDNNRARKDADHVVSRLEELRQAAVDSDHLDPGVSPVDPDSSVTVGPEGEMPPSTEGYIPDYLLNPNMDPPAVEIDGQRYIGTLELPNLGLNLPVNESWDYDKLKISPCRYVGSPYLDNMIICGHNYTTHLGRIKNLQPGDQVIFTDMDGNVFRYEVAELEIIEKTRVEDMEAGDWDLTLFTCTLARVTRVTVRCNRVAE